MRWKNRQLYKHDTNPKTKKDKLDDYLVERREKKQEKRKQAGPAMLTIFCINCSLPGWSSCIWL
ncbi:hypothetical protein ACFOLK_16640 [Marinococcus halophilus]|uniref:hypothetical protein n=1 Tax=Marinococcus halophilus TaxID=1371 RepID=UPI0036225789